VISCEHGNESLGSIKEGISLLAEWRLASHKRFMKLVNFQNKKSKI
jgi:hypothetical protein